MIKIEGEYNTAKVFIDSDIEKEAEIQIKTIVDQKIFSESEIAIMPDVHSGKGCVIGLTMTLGQYIVPNLIGVDIGCGVIAIKIGKEKISFEKLDSFIRSHIPYGFEINNRKTEIDKNLEDKIRKVAETVGTEPDKVLKSIGSLGGGNHFIEVDIDENEDFWLLIHSGSRNFGLKVAEYYQKKAREYINKNNIKIPRGLEYLPINKGGKDYIDSMKIAQEMAKKNRFEMAKRIINNFLKMDINNLKIIESVHNYIDFEDNIIRKGAISAHKGKEVVIPFNMRDGAIIGIGKGNKDYNFSAPHGAGRKMSRNKAKKSIDIDEFRRSMEGIYSTCVSRRTIDEAPFAYKDTDNIIKVLNNSVDIKLRLKPVYNFKAPE
ncbi:MAG TPA: RtcB family protein [Spirochaetota bacterium]|nr:RtcB family protein [Spirochaetota bacterium]HOM37809.1 RtcB family protein [Spirochaetota bacterium]HPQ49314.1 RtcB family protein [Spirochaetota bacterium]